MQKFGIKDDGPELIETPELMIEVMPGANRPELWMVSGPKTHPEDGGADLIGEGRAEAIEDAENRAAMVGGRIRIIVHPGDGHEGKEWVVDAGDPAWPEMVKKAEDLRKLAESIG